MGLLSLMWLMKVIENDGFSLGVTLLHCVCNNCVVFSKVSYIDVDVSDENRIHVFLWNTLD